MKTIKQLKEERSVLLAELEGYEKRSEALTAQEETRVDEIANELEQNSKLIERAEKLEAQKRTIAIQTNPIKDTEEGVKQRFSITRALEAAATGGESSLRGVEREMHQEGQKERQNCGLDSGNGVIIPRMILGQPKSNLEKRAVITENDTAGVTIISFEQALQEESVLRRAGADFQALVSDGRYVVPAAPTLAWETETGDSNDVGALPAKVNLSPKRLSGYMDITMQMIRQHTVSVENAYTEIMARAVAEALDTAAFTTNSDVTSWAGSTLTPSDSNNAGSLALALIEQLYESKAFRGNVGFVASSGLYAELYSALQVTGVTPLVVNERINMVPLYFSAHVGAISAKEAAFCANWSDYAVCQWGGIEILPDIYTQATKGTVRLVLNSFFDMAQKRAASFKLGTFSGTVIS